MTVAIQQLIWAIEGIRDAFHRDVFVARDADAALAAVTDDVTLVDQPAGTGTTGVAQLRGHLVEDVLPHVPDDLAFQRISRTSDKFRVVEEATVTFIHDRELPWLLPGVAPTGRRAEVLAISVTTFRHSRIDASRTRSLIASQRTLWDHTTLLAQLGLQPAQLAGSSW